MESRRLLSGTLDPSFNGNGVNLFDSGGVSADQIDTGRIVLTLPDQRVLMVGGNSGADPVLARYLADGTMDASLDGDGFQGTGLSIPGFKLGEVNGAVVQSTGASHRIILVGRDNGTVGNPNVGVLSLVPNANDTGYVYEWHLSQDLGSTTNEEKANGVVIQDLDGDGPLPAKLVVAATSDSINGRHVAVLRLNLDGTLDTTFGDDPTTAVVDPDGIALSNESANDLNADNQAAGIALQSDGSIVITATSSTLSASPAPRVGLLRFTPDGMLDTSFGGGDGTVLVLSAADQKPSTVAVDSNDRILVGGSTLTSPETAEFLLLRVSPDGSSIGTFAQPAPVFFSEIRDLAIQSDGKILAAGNTIEFITPEEIAVRSVIIRYDAASLAFDSAFGTNGVASVTLGGAESPGYTAHFDGARAMALQTVNGVQRVIIGGTATDLNTFDDDLFLAAFTLGASTTFAAAGAPVATITGAPTGPVNEGTSITLGASVTSGGGGVEHIFIASERRAEEISSGGGGGPLSYVWSVTKDGVAYPVANNTSASFTFTPDDGNAAYVVTLAVSEGSTAAAPVSVTIGVNNVAPTVGPIAVPDTLVRGFDNNFSVTISDANPADPQVVTWDFGDGSAAVVGGAVASHVYAASGTYTVTVTVADDHDTTTVSTVVTVTSAGIDAAGNLLLGGTAGADTVGIKPSGAGVLIDGVTYFPTGEIIVMAGSGDDLVAVAGGLSFDVYVFGGAGDDKFKGGDGNDILIGGDGADMLLGGSGRDLIIGGKGADRILGNAEDDIIIAGYTIYDGDAAALRMLHNEWASAGTFSDRVANLKNGGGLNGSFVLNSTTTVIDDAEQDILTGASGLDWFLFNSDASGVMDKVTDISTFESMFDADLNLLNLV